MNFDHESWTPHTEIHFCGIYSSLDTHYKWFQSETTRQIHTGNRNFKESTKNHLNLYSNLLMKWYFLINSTFKGKICTINVQFIRYIPQRQQDFDFLSWCNTTCKYQNWLVVVPVFLFVCVTSWRSQFFTDYDQIWQGVQLSHGVGHRRAVVTDFRTWPVDQHCRFS